MASGSCALLSAAPLIAGEGNYCLAGGGSGMLLPSSAAIARGVLGRAAYVSHACEQQQPREISQQQQLPRIVQQQWRTNKVSGEQM
nr:hypothetical protein Itr_chr02CG15350 [Ipomoea trifida]